MSSVKSFLKRKKASEGINVFKRDDPTRGDVV
jgi:hypothetical protein